MQRAWIFDRLALTVEAIDFHDPALAGQDEARERGVRIEVRRLEAALRGSVYASPGLGLAPALCRIDLLESRPHARDRMHWHPAMSDGEPDDRVMEAGIAADPVGWVRTQLLDLDRLLGSETPDAATDVAAVRAVADEITDAVASCLARVRDGSWAPVPRDDRGLALTPG